MRSALKASYHVTPHVEFVEEAMPVADAVKGLAASAVSAGFALAITLRNHAVAHHPLAGRTVHFDIEVLEAR